MSEKTTRKVESDLLLNIKDIEKFKSENTEIKFEDKRVTIDKEMERYNQDYIKAMEAPIPKISLHGNQVLTRAVPLEMKTKGGLIISVQDTDLAIANKLQTMSHAVYLHQEILMVGQHVTEEEVEHGLKPGRWCKFSLKRMRNLTDERLPGVIEVEFDVPREVIDGYPYLILDKRDIIYTYDKQ